MLNMGQLEVCAFAASCTDLMIDIGIKLTPRNTLRYAGYCTCSQATLCALIMSRPLW